MLCKSKGFSLFLWLLWHSPPSLSFSPSPLPPPSLFYHHHLQDPQHPGGDENIQATANMKPWFFCDIPSSRGQQFLPAKSLNISKHQVEVQSWQFMIINTYLKEAHVSNLVIFPFKNFQIFLFGILPSDLNFWKCLMALKLIFLKNRICILSLLSWLAD